MISLEDKIKLIENSNDINELTLDVIPPTYSENYYFVSYSHKDYKKVFKEILLLQSKGISLWYDRGMRPGKDWKEIAETMIDKYACKGVIFFVSENLVTSKACAEEMEYVKKIGKSFCSINLAASDNNIYSAAKLCELVEVSLENKKIINSIFPPSVLYLNETDPIDKKVEGLLKLKEPRLLSYTFHKQPDYLRSKDVRDYDVIDIYNVDIPEEDKPFTKYGMFHYAKLTFSFNQDIKSLYLPNHVYCNFDESICEEITESSIINKLTEIDRCCFANSRRLTEVYLPDSIEIIGESAFQGCINLEKFQFSKNVTNINDFTFHNCINLIDINLSSVETIGNNAFSECRKIENLYLENCFQIGYNAFLNCHSLKELKLNISRIPNNAFNGCQSLETIKLLDEIDHIEEYAFFDCQSLETIETTFNIERIPRCSFTGCKKLKSIQFSNLLTSIGDSAFWLCSSLESFHFNENLENIETSAFEKCISLTKLHLNDNLKEIGNIAFAGCKNIEEINFGTNLTRIGINAFHECEKIKEIILPPNIEEIGFTAFYKCISLEKIVIPKSCKKVTSILGNNPNLSEIIYNGTINEWKKIVGYDQLFYKNENYKVICLDGIYKKI